MLILIITIMLIVRLTMLLAHTQQFCIHNLQTSIQAFKFADITNKWSTGIAI